MKSKVASIRALQELKGIVEGRLASAYEQRIRTARNKVDDKKTEISKVIQKEIELMACEKFKQYGLKPVLVCSRRNTTSEDRIYCELKLEDFGSTISEAQLEYDTLRKKEQEGRQAIEDWYFNAVQAVAAQVELPETPDFK